MRPVIFRKRIYMPMPAKAGDIKSLFMLRGSRTVYTYEGKEKGCIKGKTSKGDTIRITPEYPVLILT